MPGMSGLELLKKLKGRLRACANTPVVMTTSEAAGENVIAALRSLPGAANYIIKPFGRKQLVEKIGPYIKAGERVNATSSSDGLFSPFRRLEITGEGELGKSRLSSSFSRARLGVANWNARTAPHASVSSPPAKSPVRSISFRRGEEAFYACFLCSMIKRYRFHEGAAMPPELAISMNK